MASTRPAGLARQRLQLSVRNDLYYTEKQRESNLVNVMHEAGFTAESGSNLPLQRPGHAGRSARAAAANFLAGELVDLDAGLDQALPGLGQSSAHGASAGRQRQDIAPHALEDRKSVV